jgi:hypothetical protein
MRWRDVRLLSCSHQHRPALSLSPCFRTIDHLLCVSNRYVDDPPEFNFSTGYAYAIATTSNVVMQYLKTLCAARYGAGSSRCTYAINYPGTIANA